MYDPNRPHVNDYKYRDLPFQEKLAQSERDAMLYDISKAINNTNDNTTQNNTISSRPYVPTYKYTKKNLALLNKLESYKLSLITWLVLSLLATVLTGIFVWGNPTGDKTPFHISAIIFVVLLVLDVVITVWMNYITSSVNSEKNYKQRVAENRELVRRTIKEQLEREAIMEQMKKEQELKNK